MNDDFVISKLIKKLINDFDKFLTNFPHREIELKREIMNTSYDIINVKIKSHKYVKVKKS